MKSSKALKIYKKNGAVQRSDTKLTQELADTIKKHILAGKPLYAQPVIHYKDENDTEGEIISKINIHRWYQRDNVVKETGESFRDIVDNTRKEYRVRKREERAEKLIEDTEKAFHRTMRLKTNLPIRNMFGQLVENDDGSIAKKENHNLLKVKMDTGKFLVERLDPDRYGKVDKLESKVLTFSLADLRKAKEEMEKEE